MAFFAEEFREAVYETGHRLARRYPRESLKLVVDFQIYDHIMRMTSHPTDPKPDNYMDFPIERLYENLGGYWELTPRKEEFQEDIWRTCSSCKTPMRFRLARLPYGGVVLS